MVGSNLQSYNNLLSVSKGLNCIDYKYGCTILRGTLNSSDYNCLFNRSATCIFVNVTGSKFQLHYVLLLVSKILIS